jgi:predicted acetyltransferase
MDLVIPSLKYKNSYLEALKESRDEIGETQLNKPAENQTFEEFVQDLHNQSKGINLPQGYVSASMFWLIDNNELIGRVSIRHELNDYLLKHIGHIGYYIRPSKREMGYGKKILELGLLEARKLGLSKVLVTCNDNNRGSLKIIESNGGVLENIVEEGDEKLCRYWIKLNK